MFYIIFVEPESPGNIGSVARVMKNFGFYNLILVNPVEIDDESYKLAVHAEDVLKSAIIVETLEEALTYVDVSVATSANTSGGVLRNYTAVENLAEKISPEFKVGIVLGRESSGLRNEEVEMCDTMTTIPTDKRYPTMNVSHALSIILYEIFKSKCCIKTNPLEGKEIVEKNLLIEDFKRILAIVEEREYRRDNAITVFKHVLARGFNTQREIYTLKGIFRRIILKLEGEI
ncbi:MAG: putative RNA methyltransferase [Candidatus Methanofastidiosum methylothiophilum]|uniref:Putative RNA methyltransferase n=1 Tax=Candidatus Methanofastidiosum methylothiophilum TaxID=1705564 RepID=A0A150II50_9EURY|nr:MAG: putative RNA methyltransferase [Candidatus Methanofastidiosum methylthiophilus]KYC46752.1 MAG: putative RNA methyltransferase [Candidatus Methanofastidiosum methylthiophilus]KYC49235.1 MAG: putative RNA methyltransferase [Candidatus Methanofastidiosum methylthiophilus]